MESKGSSLQNPIYVFIHLLKKFPIMNGIQYSILSHLNDSTFTFCYQNIYLCHIIIYALVFQLVNL